VRVALRTHRDATEARSMRGALLGDLADVVDDDEPEVARALLDERGCQNRSRGRPRTRHGRRASAPGTVDRCGTSTPWVTHSDCTVSSHRCGSNVGMIT